MKVFRNHAARLPSYRLDMNLSFFRRARFRRSESGARTGRRPERSRRETASLLGRLATVTPSLKHLNQQAPKVKANKLEMAAKCISSLTILLFM